MRPPALCEGCGHRDMYTVLTQVLKEEYPTYKVFSDIGCYTLGANAPFNAINSCVDMGASITMAKGASDAGLHPAVAVIGDSTFTHSGMTGLLDCVNENADVTIVISDNETTAMTGGQDSAGRRTFGSHLRRHRCSSRTHPRRSSFEEELRRDEANHPGRNRIPRRIRHHPPQRMYPNISTQKKKQVSDGKKTSYFPA